MHSQLYLYCDVAGKWIVKYRFTAATSFASAEPIAGFMRALPWTISPGQ
jgi:hypothetical protein